MVYLRQGDSLKEYELQVCNFLNSLSMHPSICMTTRQRSAAFLQRLLSDEITGYYLILLYVNPYCNIDSLDDEHVELIVTHCHATEKQKSVEECNEQKQTAMSYLEQLNIKENEDSYKNDYNDAGKKPDNQVISEPSIIPETPLKSSQPVCVGVATIRGIMPVSAGCIFPLTPPTTECIDSSLSSKPEVEIIPSFPTPSQTPLAEFQKKLRLRFPTPFVITPTEKKARRHVLRTIRSHRRPQPSPWIVAETTSPTRSCNLRKQLFLDTESCQSSANSSSSQLALYLSPDEEKNSSKSFSSNDAGDYNELKKLNTLRIIDFAKSPQNNLTFGYEKSKSPIQEKHEESYTELKKSIEGNLMGCEASLSDIELMDEIESNLNQDNDVIFMDPVSKGENDPKIEFLLPTTASPISQIAQSKKASISSASKKTPKKQEQVERRRSSRLCGTPLPLKFTSEPLPDERKPRETRLKRSSANEKDESILPSRNKKALAETMCDLPKQIAQTKASINETTAAENLADLPKLVNWQKVRLQIPSCWAEMIEKHVKIHHADEMIRFQEDTGSRWPTVYCNCAQAQQV